MLPIESKLIHCRWTGESTWIPFGDFRPGLEYENHTSHPAPGQMAIYPGGISECEIFFPYGGCTTASKVGQLAANHFATVVAGRRLGRSPARDGAALPVGGRPDDLDPRGGPGIVSGVEGGVLVALIVVTLPALNGVRRGRRG